MAKSKLEKQFEEEQGIILAPPPSLSKFDIAPIDTKTNDKKPHFLRITMSLGYEENEDLESELKQRKDAINHICRILIKDKSSEEVNSVEDTVNLAEEIKAHINSLLTKGKIKEVYFKEFVVK
jgi:flagellar FliL protein